MLSVIIPTLDSERALVPTLAALVPGATDGLVSEVLVVDGGSRDETAAVADVAGCNVLTLRAQLAKRLKAGAASARAPWLMFLRPGSILDAPWTGEARRFVEHGSPQGRAAVFRRGLPGQSGLREALSFLAATLCAPPRAEQGLLIPKRFYEEIGAHSEQASDPEADLLRRLGRRRIVRLTTSVFTAS